MRIYINLLFLSLMFLPTLSFSMEQDEPQKKHGKVTRRRGPPSSSCPGKEEGLYLVIGSTRSGGALINYWELITGKETDFTHRKTFNGKATTLNICPSKIRSLPHIQADALIYNPGRRGPIHAAFFELFPSIKDASITLNAGNADEIILTKLSYMPHALSNIGRHMCPGATLEIEHIPNIVMLSVSFYLQYAPRLKGSDPFNFYLSPLHIEALGSFKYEGSELEGYWEATKMALMKDEQWDPGTSDAVERREDGLQRLINEVRGDVFSPEVATAMFRAYGFPSDLAAAMPKTYVFYLKTASEMLKSLLAIGGIPEIEFEARLAKEIAYFKEHRSKIKSEKFINSLCSTIAQYSAVVFLHRPLILQYLRTHGFEDVKLTQYDKSPYNRRKNVWMFSGRRNDKPIGSSE